MDNIQNYKMVPMEIIAPYALSAPVDLDAMAHDLSLVVVYEILPTNISGKIERDGHQTRLTVNESHSQKRQRFTLAHLISHIILHADMIGSGITDDENYTCEKFRPQTEKQANSFAAELMMPARMVRTLYRTGTKRLDDIAKLFDVTPEAAMVRMKSLDLI